ncbi:organic cation transporter protein-like [Leptinotarsa decemlineata]|uniref:organic cation transporter protein-like n=1 Tax=Leptinotarsa decemlineata TaxID=7539 RepID=UPI003D306CE6
MRRYSVDFDDILEELGEIGTFQIFIYGLLCLPVLFSASGNMSYVFTAGVPEYRCLIPECEDQLDTSYNVPWMKWAIPNKISEDQVIGVKTDPCSRYIHENESSEFNSTVCTEKSFTNTTVACSELIFDENERTVVNDFNITCLENQWKIYLVGTIHFAGILVGTLVSGILADWFGRKLIFIFCICLMSVTGTLQVLSPDYMTFVLFIFMNSVGTAGVFPLALVLVVEMAGKNNREASAIVLNYFFAIGEAIVALIAWYSRDWVYVQLIVSTPALLFVGYYWIIPESVQWLLANGKKAEAKQVILKVAKINKVTISNSLKDYLDKMSVIKDGEPDSQREDTLTIIKQMMKSRKLVIRFMLIIFIWGVITFVFYGLSVNSTSLGGNKYLNFALVSLVEIPGFTISWICIRKLGRRISLAGSLLLCGVTCTLTIFINTVTSNWAVATMFLVGKLGATSASGVIYVYSAEIIPTVIRSGGVGTASAVARIGAILAPYAPFLSLFYNPLPMIVFGGLAISAGILAMNLPETRGIKLPETVEEAKNI